jgi:hypothetical protein
MASFDFAFPVRDFRVQRAQADSRDEGFTYLISEA